MRQKYIAISLLACVLTACSHNDENIVVNDGPVAAQITAGLNVPATRAENQTWGTDDAIGQYGDSVPQRGIHHQHGGKYTECHVYICNRHLLPR